MNFFLEGKELSDNLVNFCIAIPGLPQCRFFRFPVHNSVPEMTQTFLLTVDGVRIMTSRDGSFNFVALEALSFHRILSFLPLPDFCLSSQAQQS